MSVLLQVRARLLDKELAWSGNVKKLKLARSPTWKEIFQNADDIYDALYDLKDWYESSGSVKNFKELDITTATLRRVFGYDGYDAGLFRAIPLIDKLKSDKLHEDDIITISPGKRDFTSWTTSLSNAVFFATSEGHYSEYAVIQIKDTHTQVMSSMYLAAIIEYILGTVTAADIERARVKLEKMFKKDADKLEEHDDALDVLEQVIEIADDMVDLFRRFKREDEVILKVKPKSKVQVKLLQLEKYGGKGRAVRRKS